MAQAERELQPGEPVAWNYGAGQARGHVVGKITEDKKVGSRVFKASVDDPKYVVKSDSSGKEAVKKPETLHKLDEDGDADADEADADARENGESIRSEAGAKQKRDDLNARLSAEERKEDEYEENSKKVQDTGKGTVRASAKAARSKIKDVAKDVQLDEEEDDDELENDVEDDVPYQPEENELQVQDDEEVISTLPPEDEALAALKEAREGDTKVVDEADFIVDDDKVQDGEDETYDPVKDENDEKFFVVGEKDRKASPSDVTATKPLNKGES